MRILSLEGAPCRALGQLQVLKKILSRKSLDYRACFDCYIGGSWGGVLALCFANILPIETIEECFLQSHTYLNTVYHQVLSLLFPRACPKKMLAPFYPLFEGLQLKDLKKRVILYGYDFDYKKIITFDSHNPKDQDLFLQDILEKIVFAPSIFKPHVNTSITDVALVFKSPLFYTLISYYQEWKSQHIDVLHLGVGEKHAEPRKLRELFQKGWVYWVFSKAIFEEIDSIGAVYQNYLTKVLHDTAIYPSLKIQTLQPQIAGGVDFSFMGDVSLTPTHIMSEVDAWISNEMIDHLEF
jgi:hypothetical protein